MEGIAVDVYKKLKLLWRGRGYNRLNVNGTRRKRNKAQFGSRRQGFWRIKFVPRLRIMSSKKFMIGLRDAYINMMLRIARSSAVAGGGGGGYSAVDYGIGGFGMRSVKEYDEKVIIEIYNSLVMTQGHLLTRNQERN